MKKLTVGLVQHSCTEDLEANKHKSVNGIRKAVSRGAELIVPGDGEALSILHQMLDRARSGAPTGLLPTAIFPTTALAA